MVVRSTVTCRSAFDSSNADWVRGVARLISSTKRICVKSGPCRKTNSLYLLAYIFSASLTPHHQSVMPTHAPTTLYSPLQLPTSNYSGMLPCFLGGLVSRL